MISWSGTRRGLTRIITPQAYPYNSLVHNESWLTLYPRWPTVCETKWELLLKNQQKIRLTGKIYFCSRDLSQITQTRICQAPLNILKKKPTVKGAECTDIQNWKLHKNNFIFILNNIMIVLTSEYVLLQIRLWFDW